MLSTIVPRPIPKCLEPELSLVSPAARCFSDRFAYDILTTRDSNDHNAILGTHDRPRHCVLTITMFI